MSDVEILRKFRFCFNADHIERLPDYEAAVDALEALWWADDKPSHVEGPDGRHHDIEVILAPLRPKPEGSPGTDEDVPAHPRTRPVL